MLHCRGLVEDDVATCELVFGELLANALKYGENPVSAAIEIEDDHVRLEVEDAGKCFSIPPRLAAPLDSIGGRGLFIASALTWSLEVDRSSDRCRVVASLQRRRAPELRNAS